MTNRPIRVFYSPLSGKFYASARYRITNGAAIITGEQFDVTSDIGAAVEKYGLSFHREGESLTASDSRFAPIVAALQRAVDLYGTPGGPWNVPGDPGGWLEQARSALEEAPPLKVG